MPKFRLSAKAKADLKSIALYTQKTWGREQRNKYLAKLDESFYSLSREPQRGRACDDIREGYFKHHVGRHLIFYRQSAEGIEIIRILHDRMDVDGHFTDD